MRAAADHFEAVDAGDGERQAYLLSGQPLALWVEGDIVRIAIDSAAPPRPEFVRRLLEETLGLLHRKGRGLDVSTADDLPAIVEAISFTA